MASKSMKAVVAHDYGDVIDTVGGDLVERSLKVVRKGGVITTSAGMPPPDLGKAMGIPVASANRASTGFLGQISGLLADKTIGPCAGKAFGLADVRRVHELCQTGHGRGHIVLHVPD